MSAVPPLRVAVVGTGHLGSIHARIYHELPEVELVTVVDQDAERGGEIASRYGAKHVTDYRTILGDVDAVSIATPTITHGEIAKAFLESGVPTLVEKPITHSVDEAEELVEIARTRGLPLQVGHVERFNPAMLALKDDVRHPLFIEAHRISPFSFRSTDIGVVLDLMIHDLDLILALVDSPVAEIRAVGVNVLSPKTEDIANARVTFESGCVANITASRISEKVMRKMRFFTSSAYATVDFRTREAYIYRKAENLQDMPEPSPVPGMDQVGPDELEEALAQMEALEAQVNAWFENARGWWARMYHRVDEGMQQAHEGFLVGLHEAMEAIRRQLQEMTPPALPEDESHPSEREPQ